MMRKIIDDQNAPPLSPFLLTPLNACKAVKSAEQLFLFYPQRASHRINRQRVHDVVAADDVNLQAALRFAVIARLEKGPPLAEFDIDRVPVALRGLTVTRTRAPCRRGDLFRVWIIIAHD